MSAPMDIWWVVLFWVVLSAVTVGLILWHEWKHLDDPNYEPPDIFPWM